VRKESKLGIMQEEVDVGTAVNQVGPGGGDGGVDGGRSVQWPFRLCGQRKFLFLSLNNNKVIYLPNILIIVLNYKF